MADVIGDILIVFSLVRKVFLTIVLFLNAGCLGPSSADLFCFFSHHAKISLAWIYLGIFLAGHER